MSISLLNDPNFANQINPTFGQVGGNVISCVGNLAPGTGLGGSSGTTNSNPGQIWMDASQDPSQQKWKIFGSNASSGGLTDGNLEFWSYNNSTTPIYKALALMPQTNTVGTVLNVAGGLYTQQGMVGPNNNPLSSATTIQVYSTGSFSVSQGSAFTITMPPATSLTAGSKFRFLLGQAGANTVVVSCPSGSLMCKIIISAGAYAQPVISTAHTSLSFVASTAVVGDYIDMEIVQLSAGTYGYFAVACTNATGGISTA